MFSTIGSWFSSSWTWVKDAAVASWNFVLDHAETVLTWLADNVIQPVWGWVKSGWNWSKTAAQTVWGWVKSSWNWVTNLWTANPAATVAPAPSANGAPAPAPVSTVVPSLEVDASAAIATEAVDLALSGVNRKLTGDAGIPKTQAA